MTIHNIVLLVIQIYHVNVLVQQILLLFLLEKFHVMVLLVFVVMQAKPL